MIKIISFELQEKQQGYEVNVIPVIIGCYGGPLRELKRDLRELLYEKTTEQMTKEKKCKR